MRDNIPAGVALGLGMSGTTSGTAVTSSSTANTLGSWVSLGTSPPYPMNCFRFFQRQNSTNNLGTCLFNIGFGASGSQVVMVPNLTASMVGISHSSAQFEIPLFIPPSTEIWVQSQDSVGGTTFGVGAELDFRTDWPLQAGMITPLGIVTTTSSGTLIASGASYNTLYTNSLFTTPARRFGRFLAVLSTQSSGSYATVIWRFQTSGGVPLMPYKHFPYNGGYDSTQLMGSHHLSSVPIPPSTAIELQYQYVADSTSFNFNCALYGCN